MTNCTLTDELLNGRYKIVRPLGTGGMGQTYLAEDTRRPGNPPCVVKQLKPASTDPKFLVTAKRLFENEAVILEKLGRSNDRIPQLLERFEKDGEFYLIQDFVDGEPLSIEMPLGERWSEAQVIKLLQEVLPILDAVHQAGIIHRDIKPDNLIRRKDNTLCLIDFGAVKQIRNHQSTHSQLMSVTVPVGTPGYMPTEQSKGKPRPNSDLYALGMVAIQALTGMLPSLLREDKTGEVIWRDQAEVSDDLAGFLEKMTRYHFKDRFETADEASQALHQFIAVKSTQPASESNNSTQQSVKRPYQPTVEVEPEQDTAKQQSTVSESGGEKESSTVEKEMAEEPMEQVITEPLPKQKSSTGSDPANKNRLLIVLGTAIATFSLIAGTTYIQTRSQQERTIQRIEKAFADNQFDECITQAQSFPKYHADLYVNAQAVSSRCQAAKTQQRDLQDIQKLKSDGRFAEAIRKAEAFSDTQSKFYGEVRKIMAESQVALAQQLAGKNTFAEAIAILTKIDTQDASLQQKAQALKFEWSDRIYSTAETLYQTGRDRKDFNRALEMAKSVPQGSPTYERAQAMIKQWEATEPKNWDDLEAAQQAIREGRWQDVKGIANRLLSSPSQAWRKQGQSLNAQAEEGERKEATPIDAEGKLSSGEIGVLTRADNNTLFKDYEFNGREGDALIIGLRGDFDTKLYLISPDKQEIELNDDVSGSNRNSSITTKLRQTGIYKVRVNAYYRTDDSQQRGQGSYQVIVHRETK